MSHFIVMVVVNHINEIDEALAPYHEYECTGNKDEYVKFVLPDETKEQLLEKFEEVKGEYGYKSFDVYMEHYYGYEKHKMKWGRWTNPDARWDWYQVGGRWTGALKLKESAKGIYGELGVPASFDIEEGKAKIEDIQKAGFCDVTQKKHIDMDGMNKPLMKMANDRWQKFHDTIAKHEVELVLTAWKKRIDGDSSTFKSKPIQDIIRKTEDIIKRLIWGYKDFKNIGTMTKDNYIECAGTWAPYSVLWNNKWYDSGEMGMFGMSYNEEPQWTGAFTELWKSISDDKVIALVDCHK